MEKPLSRLDKFLPPDGTIPDRAKFVCRSCNLWVSSNSGRTGHLETHPGHTMYSPKTNHEWTGSAKMRKSATPAARPALAIHSNGHSMLDASARDMLLDYVLGKAKEELNSELDRMFRELKSQPIPQRGARRTYVAR